MMTAHGHLRYKARESMLSVDVLRSTACYECGSRGTHCFKILLRLPQ